MNLFINNKNWKSNMNKPYDKVLGAAKPIKLKIHLIVYTTHFYLSKYLAFRL